AYPREGEMRREEQLMITGELFERLRAYGFGGCIVLVELQAPARLRKGHDRAVREIANVEQARFSRGDFISNVSGRVTHERDRGDARCDASSGLESMNPARDGFDQVLRALRLHPSPFGAGHTDGRFRKREV